MQISALYPSLFGYSVAAAHYLASNRFTERVTNDYLEKVADTIVKELPDENDALKEAEEQWVKIGGR